MNLIPQEIKYCVVCDNTIITLENSDEVVCSEECRVTFEDFEVLYSFKECFHCRGPVMNGNESDFCSEDCCQTHEYFEYLRAHCIQCDLKMPEPITSKFCGELCEKQFALERYWDEHEKYVEDMRQQHVDEERDYY